MTSNDEDGIPPTPQTEAEFTPDWFRAVTRKYFEQEGRDPDKISLVGEVRAAKNELQGILSTTFVVEADLRNEEPNEDVEEEEVFSIFVKVPLQGEPMYHSVNTRELTMFKVTQKSRQTQQSRLVPTTLFY